VENWGCFVKKVDLSSTHGALCTLQYQYFLFYILIICGVRTLPTHPLLSTGLTYHQPAACHHVNFKCLLQKKQLLNSFKKTNVFQTESKFSYLTVNKWSPNFDEKPHRPRICHPRGGDRESILKPRFCRDALSSAVKSAAP